MFLRGTGLAAGEGSLQTEALRLSYDPLYILSREVLSMLDWIFRTTGCGDSPSGNADEFDLELPGAMAKT